MSLKYEIVANAGRGTYSQVFKVKELTFGNLFAAKISPSRHKSIIEYEVSVHKNLEHPNIVQYVGAFWIKKCELEVGTQFEPLEGYSYGDFHVIIMEFCEGKNLYLEGVFALKKFDANLIRSCACDVANAILHMKNKKVMHRDIKPENLIITKSGIKVCDFGLSSTFDDAWKSGTGWGTPYYMPYDSFNGCYYETTDVFSLGVILFEMACGRHPFPAGNSRSTLLSLLKNGTFFFPVDVDVNEDLKDLITKMLLKDSNNRIKIEEVLAHKFLNEFPPKVEEIAEETIEVQSA